MDDSLRTWFDPATITPWDLCFAVLAILAGWIASNFAKKGMLAVLRRLRGLAPGTQLLMARVVKYAIILLAIGVGLSFLGASVQPLLAMALIVGVVAVLALRGISTNFAAGVVLQTRQPIHVGDEIETAGFVGIVQELNARAVVVRTRDGRTVHLPNAGLLDSPLVNRSVPGRLRSEVEVRVVVEQSGVASLRTALVAATTHTAGVLDDQPVTITTVLLADDRATLHVRFWHHARDRVQARSAVVEELAAVIAGRGLVFSVSADLPAPPLTTPPSV